MPSKDTYGSQPPLELLRTWLDHGYWSDLIDTTKIELVDMVNTWKKTTKKLDLQADHNLWLFLLFSNTDTDECHGHIGRQ